MIKSKIPIKKMRQRGQRLQKLCEEPIDAKLKTFREYIMKLENGNEGMGYSRMNIMTSYYSQKITGLYN